MRRIVIAAVVLSLAVISLPMFDAHGGQKGASAKAYEHASDEAIFHRIGDWFATRGKSETEKKAIIAERKAKRAAARAQKEAEKQKKKIEKEAKKAKKNIQMKMKGSKKGSGR